MNSIKVSIIQMYVRAEDTVSNRERAKCLITKAAIEKPDIIMLPEMWTTGFHLNKIKEICDIEGRPTLDMIRNLAKNYNLNIISGSFANIIGKNIYNSAFVVNRKGEIVADYNKIHLFKTMQENEYFNGGDEICTFEIEGIKCGLIICYDLRFPELARKLALQGIKILFVSAQWPAARIEHWNILLRARAIENQIFVVACNIAGEYREDTFNGNSMIISPLGEIIEVFDYKEQHKCFSLDINMINLVRSRINYLADRRPDLY